MSMDNATVPLLAVWVSGESSGNQGKCDNQNNLGIPTD
jgi:hypothetical protein